MGGGEADRLKLLKIAMEGFNMLDACRHMLHGRNDWAVERNGDVVPPARAYYPITEAAPGKAGSVIDSKEAAKMYGGLVIAEFPSKGFNYQQD